MKFCENFENFRNWVFWNFQKCTVIINDNACDSKSVSLYHLPFLHKNVKLAIFSKFRTHDLEKLSPNYEKAPPTQHRQYFYLKMLHPVVTEICSRQNKKLKNWQFFQHFEPMTLKFWALTMKGTPTQHKLYCCKVWRCNTL